MTQSAACRYTHTLVGSLLGGTTFNLHVSMHALQLESYCSPGVLAGHWLFASLPLAESPVWLPC